MIRTHRIALLAGAALGAGAATPAHADEQAQADASSSGLETVVVTAQRRVQNAQDVGITMSVLAGDDMKTAGLTSSPEIADFTPGVHMGGSLAGQSMQFSIRGVTQNDFSDSIEAPVAVYIDDAYIPSQQGQTLAMFDVDRVEILKGPQGTLFGRNATGGLVHFVINTPSDVAKGYANLSYGNLGETKVEAAFGGPLTDRFLARASVFYNRLDNFWDNVYPKGAAADLPTQFGPPLSTCCHDEGGYELYAGRLQLQFNATDDLSFRLVGAAASRKLSTAAYTSVATTPVVNAAGNVINVIRTPSDDTRTIIGPDGNNYFNPTLFPLQGAQTGIGYGPAPGLRFPGNTWFGYRPLDPKDLKLSTQYANSDSNEDSTASVGLHIDYDFGDFSFVSLTNYQSFDKMLMMDAAGTPQNLFQYGTDASTDSFSQEFRLNGKTDSLRWVAGLYYLDIDASAKDGLLGSTGSLFAGVFDLSLTGVDPLADRTLKTKSASLFGQIEYDLTSKWTVIAGARAVQEKQNYDLAYYAAENRHDYKVDSHVLFPLPYDPFKDKRTDNLWAGKLQIEYRPADGLLWYLGVNRGVKAGSYNAKIFDGTPNIDPSEIPYDPETLISYEGGVKWTPTGLPVSLNATVFHYDYSDYQAFLFTTNTGVVQNVDANTDGLEVQFNALIGDNLHASLGYAYTDAEIPHFEVAPGVFRTVHPTFTSEHAAAMQLRYDVPADILGGRMELGGSVTYSSSFFHNLRNFDADELDGRTLANADVSWYSGEERFQVTGYIKNITDERYATVGFNSAANCGCSIEAYGLPRTYGLSLTTRF